MNLRLRTRLLLMVALPLLCMAAVLTWNTFEKVRVVREMGRLEKLVTFSTQIGALVHELQKERGMSAGFIGSGGANFATELPAQRGDSDKRLAAYDAARPVVQAAGFGASFDASVQTAQQILAELAAKRQAVGKLAIQGPEAIGYYTRTITALLDISGQLATLSSDKNITRLASAYGALLQAKERAGIERATLSNAFGADRFAPELLVRFLGNAAAQDTWLGLFNRYASEAQRQFMSEKLKGPAVDEVAATKQAAIARMNEAALGMDAKPWFKAATARIDLMKEVEDRLVDDLTTAMAGLEAESSQTAWVFAIANVVALLAVLIIALQVTRRIIAQIGGEPETAVNVAHAVADGKLDNHIELKAGDNGSILATMQRMQTQLRERIEAERAVAAENLRIKIALDNVSTGVIIADTTRTIIYTNKSVQRILKDAEADIRQQLPNFDADKLVGTNIDAFHKNPAHQAKILAEFDSRHAANLQVGARHLTVTANPVFNEQGERLGSVAEWQDRTAEVVVEQEVEAIIVGAAEGDFMRRLGTDDKTGFFRNLAEGLNRLMETASSGLAAVANILNALARGDLTQKMEGDYRGTFGQLKDDTNTTVERLREVVGQIKESTEAINTAAQEIAAGNQDLSSRTEQQASSLEETASSMEELNATVRQNAESARQANELATSSNEIAVRGGQMVKGVVKTMTGIQASSQKIADIVGVIDSIAFQTNILALNAAVEAARAGEQGRGFAVVATEVRNLAQRSATAAKEIKLLIGDSVDKVEDGVRVVNEAGATMDEVVASFQRVAHLVTDITNASREQSSGIEQVTQAVTQMDEVTQQNAALVEEAAAAAESLEEQARGLMQAVSMFKLAEGATPPGPALRDATPRQLAGKVGAGKTVEGGTAKLPTSRLVDDEDEWGEF